MCVLSGINTEQYDQIMRWWGSKPQSGISQVLDSSAYYFVLIPSRPCYFSIICSNHTSSSVHLCLPRLSTSITAYHTRSFIHLSISCLCPSILTSRSTLPPPSGSYCMTLLIYPLLLSLPKDSCQGGPKFFSLVSWHHHTFLLIPPPS